ncbi:MAG: YcxB family protein [Lachnospiraceae bacterium]|nr:YcxB family protein [Lachnospiraceae bacterium]
MEDSRDMAENENMKDNHIDSQNTEIADGVSVTVNMRVKYMYSFLFQHVHRSLQGLIGVGISLAALVMFFMSIGKNVDGTRMFIMLVIGLLFTVINPILLLFRAARQVTLSPVYKQPLTYVFTEQGMTVKQGEQSQFMEWKKLVMVRKTASVLILYTNRNSGSILAFQELGEQKDAVIRIITEGCHMAGIKRIPKSMRCIEKQEFI